jgi:geranylgeranyl reductase family protein
MGDGEVHVWRVPLDFRADRTPALRAVLDAEELARANRFVFARHRGRYIAAHGIVRELLGRYLGRASAALRFERAPHGKPYVVGARDRWGRPIRFSLSHSGDAALIAVSVDREVGVDLEAVRERDVLGIARHFFSEVEVTALRRLPRHQQLTAFYRCWTCKEAYLKACGTGLAMRLDSFDVTFEPGARPRLARSERAPDEPSRWTITDLEPSGDFAGALVAAGEPDRVVKRCLEDDGIERPTARSASPRARRAGKRLDADIIVVGAGPAGASTAIHLRRAGLDVVLLESKGFPRDKVCGDFVGPFAMMELQRLGFANRPLDVHANCVRRASLFLDGEELICRALPAGPGLSGVGRVVRRVQLDRWLAETAVRAGATLREGSTVTEVGSDDDGSSVTVRAAGARRALRARVVVAADGSNSRIARSLRGGATRTDRRITAVRAYYTDVEGPVDRADLYFAERSFPGYAWVFPTAEGAANVGVGMLFNTVPRASQHLRELLLELVGTDPALRTRLAGARLDDRIVAWPLATFDPGQPIVADRLLLVGDAAGLINPLNGEGIQYALLSGRWAAEAVAAGVDRGSCSARELASYTARVHEHMRYDMALAQMIVCLIRNRALNGIWLGALRAIVARAHRDLEFAELAGGILVGVVPARDVASRRVVAAAIEEALRSAAAGAVLALGGRGEERSPRSPGHAADALRAPGALLRWGLALTPAAFELATCAATDLLQGRTPDA